MGHIFDVAAAPNLTINKLKKTILASEDCPTVFRQRNFTAGDISLWKPTEDLPDNRNKILETTGSWQLNPDTGKEVDGRAIFLTSSSTVGDEFSSPAPACVHVIVQPPSREDLNIGMRMRRLRTLA